MTSISNANMVKRRLAVLLSDRMVWFAGVGVIGTVLNLGIMVILLESGTHYLLAAILATELTILSNFLMQERLVFNGTAAHRPFVQRLLVSFGFNNLETLVRIPVLMFLVEGLVLPGVLAQALTLASAFLARFAFTSRVIYKVRPSVDDAVLMPSTAVTPEPVDPIYSVNPVGVKLA